MINDLTKNTGFKINSNIEKKCEITPEEEANTNFNIKNVFYEKQETNNIHLNSSFNVAIRFRPAAFQDEGEREIWKLSNTSIYDVAKSSTYYFDHIFDQDSTNYTIYNNLIKDAIITCFNGINVTIFAYGQTSSGKTHTMFGDNRGSYDGVIPLSVNDLFFISDANKKSKKKTSTITVSYLEVYNEKLFDLLVPHNCGYNSHENNLKKIKIVDGPDGAVDFVNLTSKHVTSPEDVHILIKAGLKARKVAETAMNERSSRSHTILRIRIESQELSKSEVCVGILNFVDLAGSESIKRTQLEGDRRKEGFSINRSLLALSHVISQLSEKPILNECITNNQNAFLDGNTQIKSKFINYRDSKITRILSDSLGGNSKTIIICNCSPDRNNYYETLSTIEFAKRAKNVQNKVKVNMLKTNDKSEIFELKQKISSLRKQIDESIDLKLENEVLRKQNEELNFEINEIKMKWNSNALNWIDEKHEIFCDPCSSYKNQFNHLLNEYAEIIDVKDQNISKISQELSYFRHKVRNTEKLKAMNNELKREIAKKKEKIINRDLQIDELSKLIIENSHKSKNADIQLSYKNSLIEGLIGQNEKRAIQCVELENELKNLSKIINIFLSWYLICLKREKTQEIEKADYVNIEELEFTSNLVEKYTDLSLSYELSKTDNYYHNSESMDILDEMFQLESDLKFYAEEKCKIYTEMINSQACTINKLTNIALALTELLNSFIQNRNRSFYSNGAEIENISISDTYKINKKLKDSDKLIELLKSKLNKKKEMEMSYKLLQLELERSKNDIKDLTECLFEKEKENKELITSINELRHKINRVSSPILNFNSNNSGELHFYSNKIVHNSDDSNSLLSPDNQVQKENPTNEKELHENNLRELPSEENEFILDSSEIIYGKSPDNSISNQERNKLTECITQ
ncbi:kinesin heavy chain [Cryptosporidium felis]|nr:kinesin heavy chain [Cryptosporidium felis]